MLLISLLLRTLHIGNILKELHKRL